MQVPNPNGGYPLVLRDNNQEPEGRPGELLLDYVSNKIYYVNRSSRQKNELSKSIYNKIINTKLKNSKIKICKNNDNIDVDEPVIPNIQDRQPNTWYMNICPNINDDSNIPEDPSSNTVTIHFANNPYQDYSSLGISMTLPDDIIVDYGTQYDEANIPIPEYTYSGPYNTLLYWVIDPQEEYDGDGTRVIREDHPFSPNSTNQILTDVTLYPYFFVGLIT